MAQMVLTAVIIMSGLACIFGIILAIAYRFLRVEEDPRIEIVESMLPGNNCGACGEPGCRAFATKLVSLQVMPAKCTVSSAGGIKAIAEFLNVDAGSVEKRVARIHCAGGKGLVKELAQYTGKESCAAEYLVNGGNRACAWGCLGLGDCEDSCTFNAIHMNAIRLPVVDVDRCTACGDCVDACPINLFRIEPLSQKLIVQCNSPLEGEAARSVCAVACDACGRCVSDSGLGVLAMQGGLPRILKPEATSASATLRCPTGAIQWVEDEQFK
ncbi:(Fe-S)-binding protein [Deltaproteobacteria bacterium TL4]